eukprot:4280949-Pyramimonas_sp.AAC.1
MWPAHWPGSRSQLRTLETPLGGPTLGEHAHGLVRRDNVTHLMTHVVSLHAWKFGVPLVWLHPPPTLAGHVSG